MILETQRLILRPWEESDAPSRFEYACDPDIGPIAGWQPDKNVEDSLRIIKDLSQKPECYAVCLKENSKLAGCIYLHFSSDTDLTEREDECELGYWIGKPFWGKGLIPEAVKALLRHAFEDLGLRAVWCAYYDGNDKSKRVQEKCGFMYQFTSTDVEVPEMNEIRTGHVNLMTRQWWQDGLAVRSLKDSEISSAMELAWRVFEQYDLPDDPQINRQELHDALSEDSFLDGLSVYGAFSHDTLIGMISARGDKICQLFVESSHMRKGIGTLLFKRLLCDRIGHTLTANSSDLAVSFYQSLGFRITGDRFSKNGLSFTPMTF